MTTQKFAAAIGRHSANKLLVAKSFRHDCYCRQVL